MNNNDDKSKNNNQKHNYNEQSDINNYYTIKKLCVPITCGICYQYSYMEIIYYCKVCNIVLCQNQIYINYIFIVIIKFKMKNNLIKYIWEKYKKKWSFG